MRPPGSPEVLEARRKIAARLFAHGKTLTEVAAAVGCSVSSAYRWKERWRHGGSRSLRARQHLGRHPRMSPEQHKELLVALKQGTSYWDYSPSGWTCPLVQDLIHRQFGVEYHVDYVGTL